MDKFKKLIKDYQEMYCELGDKQVEVGEEYENGELGFDYWDGFNAAVAIVCDYSESFLEHFKVNP